MNSNKFILLLLFAFTLVSCTNYKQIQVKSNGVIEVVKCLFNSEVLQNDFWELVEVLKGSSYLDLIKIILKIIPDVSQEYIKCSQ
jgi:hypothetical protein